MTYSRNPPATAIVASPPTDNPSQPRHSFNFALKLNSPAPPCRLLRTPNVMAFCPCRLYLKTLAPHCAHPDTIQRLERQPVGRAAQLKYKVKYLVNGAQRKLTSSELTPCPHTFIAMRCACSLVPKTFTFSAIKLVRAPTMVAPQ